MQHCVQRYSASYRLSAYFRLFRHRGEKTWQEEVITAAAAIMEATTVHIIHIVPITAHRTAAIIEAPDTILHIKARIFVRTQEIGRAHV